MTLHTEIDLGDGLTVSFDGELIAAAEWTTVAGDCAGCAGHSAEAEGEGCGDGQRHRLAVWGTSRVKTVRGGADRDHEAAFVITEEHLDDGESKPGFRAFKTADELMRQVERLAILEPKVAGAISEQLSAQLGVPDPIAEADA